MEHVLRFSEDSQQDLPLFFQAHASLLPLRQKRKRVESKKKENRVKRKERKGVEEQAAPAEKERSQKLKTFFSSLFPEDLRRGKEKEKEKEKEKGKTPSTSLPCC